MSNQQSNEPTRQLEDLAHSWESRATALSVGDRSARDGGAIWAFRECAMTLRDLAAGTSRDAAPERPDLVVALLYRMGGEVVFTEAELVRFPALVMVDGAAELDREAIVNAIISETVRACSAAEGFVGGQHDWAFDGSLDEVRSRALIRLRSALSSVTSSPTDSQRAAALDMLYGATERAPEHEAPEDVPTLLERLQAIRKRLESVSAAPWHIAARGTEPYYRIESPSCDHVANVFDFEDVEFIVHAREDVSMLLAEVERLWACLDCIREMAPEGEFFVQCVEHAARPPVEMEPEPVGWAGLARHRGETKWVVNEMFRHKVDGEEWCRNEYGDGTWESALVPVFALSIRATPSEPVGPGGDHRQPEGAGQSPPSLGWVLGPRVDADSDVSIPRPRTPQAATEQAPEQDAEILRHRAELHAALVRKANAPRTEQWAACVRSLLLYAGHAEDCQGFGDGAVCDCGYSANRAAALALLERA